jgi:predicted YcjX-like family ATPase
MWQMFVTVADLLQPQLAEHWPSLKVYIFYNMYMLEFDRNIILVDTKVKSLLVMPPHDQREHYEGLNLTKTNNFQSYKYRSTTALIVQWFLSMTYLVG